MKINKRKTNYQKKGRKEFANIHIFNIFFVISQNETKTISL